MVRLYMLYLYFSVDINASRPDFIEECADGETVTLRRKIYLNGSGEKSSTDY